MGRVEIAQIVEGAFMALPELIFSALILQHFQILQYQHALEPLQIQTF